jgi:hypothetical protein
MAELNESFVRMTRPPYEINVCLPMSELRRQRHLTDRGPDDVRDGYIHLLPSGPFKNIALLTKNEACQTNLRSKDAEMQTYPGHPINKSTAYEFEIPLDFQDIWHHVETDEEVTRSFYYIRCMILHY